MRYIRDYWYFGTLPLFFIAMWTLVFRFQSFSAVEVILLAQFMALLAHEFEEYIFLGGLAPVLNVAMFGEKQDY